MNVRTSQRADLAEAKARREQAEAVKVKSILRMHGNEVPTREIASELRVSKSFVDNIIARSRT